MNLKLLRIVRPNERSFLFCFMCSVFVFVFYVVDFVLSFYNCDLGIIEEMINMFSHVVSLGHLPIVEQTLNDVVLL